MLAGTRMHAHAGKIPAPGTASSLSPSSSARLLLGICGCARVNEDEQRKRPAKTTDFCTRPHMCLLARTALPQRHLEVRLQRHLLTSACGWRRKKKFLRRQELRRARTMPVDPEKLAKLMANVCVRFLSPRPGTPLTAHSAPALVFVPVRRRFQRHQRPCCSVPRRHWRLRRDCARRRAARHTGWQPRTQRAAGC